MIAEYAHQPAFVHSCIERALLSMENGRSRWRNPPIDSDIDAGYIIRMIYWPARYRSDIHRHNLWTVTGVIYNSIEVVKYDADGVNEIARFSGGVGAVGKVVPPCVHAAENNTDVPAVTLAVFSRSPPQSRAGAEVDWITDTEEAKYAAGAYERALRAFVFMMNGSSGPDTLDLLDKVFDLARPSLQLLAVKAIAQIDPARAVRRLTEIEYAIEDAGSRAQIADVKRALEDALAT